MFFILYFTCGYFNSEEMPASEVKLSVKDKKLKPAPDRAPSQAGRGLRAPSQAGRGIGITTQLSKTKLGKLPAVRGLSRMESSMKLGNKPVAYTENEMW